MISLDTNILLPALETGNGNHKRAAAFIETIAERRDVAVAEFILVELYNLLRNPAVMPKPLTPTAAVDVCEGFRHHPHWQILGFPADSRAFHDSFWPRLRTIDFARRRAYDWRAAHALVRQGVTEFATVNIKDFQGFGFAKVWNPLT